jgi:hypothetical protein
MDTIKMKIERTEKNLKVAAEILAYLQGDDEIVASRIDPVITIGISGQIHFYNRACGIGGSEIVLADGDIASSFGDGWDTAEPSDVISFFEETYDGHGAPKAMITAIDDNTVVLEWDGYSSELLMQEFDCDKLGDVISAGESDTMTCRGWVILNGPCKLSVGDSIQLKTPDNYIQSDE